MFTKKNPTRLILYTNHDSSPIINALVCLRIYFDLFLTSGHKGGGGDEDYLPPEDQEEASEVPSFTHTHHGLQKKAREGNFQPSHRELLLLSRTLFKNVGTELFVCLFVLLLYLQSVAVCRQSVKEEEEAATRGDIMLLQPLARLPPSNQI